MNDDSSPIGRRQFLIVSSAALATAALQPRLLGAEAIAPKRLAVGFADSADSKMLVDASAVPAGDGGFIGRGARVALSGASGALDPGSRRAVELLVHYSYFEGADRRDAPFRAWACSRATGCQGSPLRFTVPVDETQKIDLTVGIVQTLDAGSSTTRRHAIASVADPGAIPISLTLLSGAGIKLVRGFYVIVPLFDGDRAPRWSDYHLGIENGRRTLLDTMDGVAPFEHFVLHIDYAS